MGVCASCGECEKEESQEREAAGRSVPYICATPEANLICESNKQVQSQTTRYPDSKDEEAEAYGRGTACIETESSHCAQTIKRLKGELTRATMGQADYSYPTYPDLVAVSTPS